MTGQIPQSFIENLLARTDIIEVINARVPLRRAGANFVACCPFHNEKTPSFTVNASKQFYHCFGCGLSGDAIQFLTEYEGLHFIEAIEILANRAGLSVPTEASDKNPSVQYGNLYACLAKAADFYQAKLYDQNIAHQAHAYLRHRGITGKTAKEFGLGYAPSDWDSLIQYVGTDPQKLQELYSAGLIIKKSEKRFYDRFRDRILFPIRDRRGRVVGFGGRVIGKEGEPKYLNSPETPVFNKGQELYGLYEARKGNRALTSLLVVEGYMDVVSLSQAGIKNVVATLGTALTTKQVELLFRQVDELIFCFDGDKAGKQAAKRALPLILPHMKEGQRVRFILLPEGDDPDSFVQKEGANCFLEKIERAIPLSDFLFQHFSENLDLQHLDGRAQFINMVKPLIKLLPEGVFQQMLYEKLAEITGVGVEIIQGKRPGNFKKATRSNQNLMKTRALPTTPASRATAILLKARQFIHQVGDVTAFAAADTPGVGVLCEVIDILRVEPEIDPEMIAEKLSPEQMSQFSYEALKAIVAAIPDTGLEQEFLGAIQRLRERAEEQGMESLLMKAQSEELSWEEKSHLKALLAKKEKNRVDQPIG